MGKGYVGELSCGPEPGFVHELYGLFVATVSEPLDCPDGGRVYSVRHIFRLFGVDRHWWDAPREGVLDRMWARFRGIRATVEDGVAGITVLCIGELCSL